MKTQVLTFKHRRDSYGIIPTPEGGVILMRDNVSCGNKSVEYWTPEKIVESFRSLASSEKEDLEFYLNLMIKNKEYDKNKVTIDDLNPTAIYNTQFYLTGPMPILSDKLSYYFSLRRLYNDGWLYGQRRYNPADSSNFQTADAIYIEQTGDNKSVPMNDNSQYYANAKFVFSITPELKLSYSFLGDLSQNRYYNHIYKYNPDGKCRASKVT